MNDETETGRARALVDKNAAAIREAHGKASAGGAHDAVVILVSCDPTRPRDRDPAYKILSAALPPFVTTTGPTILTADEDGLVKLLLTAGFSARDVLAELDSVQVDTGACVLGFGARVVEAPPGQAPLLDAVRVMVVEGSVTAVQLEPLAVVLQRRAEALALQRRAEPAGSGGGGSGPVEITASSSLAPDELAGAVAATLSAHREGATA
jgi:hypothetical protein